MRSEFTRAVKVAAFVRAEGKCEEIDAEGRRCNKRLVVGDINYDHVIPDGIGGKPTLDNCACLCKSHHLSKTFRTDIPTIAKGKRVAANHIGASNPRRPPSKFKRKMDGSVVDRATGLPIKSARPA